jgi:hypothetical protein
VSVHRAMGELPSAKPDCPIRVPRFFAKRRGIGSLFVTQTNSECFKDALRSVSCIFSIPALELRLLYLDEYCVNYPHDMTGRADALLQSRSPMSCVR